MRLAIPLFALSAALIIAAWAWLGAPVGMPANITGAGGKLHCVSYAPFRRGQSPLIATTRIEPFQIGVRHQEVRTAASRVVHFENAGEAQLTLD